MSTGAYHGSHDLVTGPTGVPQSYQRLVSRYTYNDEQSFVTEFKKNKDELAAVDPRGGPGSRRVRPTYQAVPADDEGGD